MIHSYMPCGAVFSKEFYMSKITTFFRETYTEMKHVNWPSRKRAVIYALVVIIFSAALGYLLGGFDTLFRSILQGALY